MTAIKAENLTKIYKLYNQPQDRLKESLHPFKKQYHRDFYALRDVSFAVQKGETVGIIGPNGAGKSTLLKIVTGLLTPSAGDLMVNGRISSLLELGAGFNPEFTGLENIYLNGTIMGYTREEMNARLDAILAFAEIGDFINQPVKTYSSGMFVRLAFAVATNVSPDIFIVDEALSVGDMRFQNKCYKAIKGFVNNGTTLLFVSHSLSAIRLLCDTTIWLDKGNIKTIGNTESVTKRYEQEMLESSIRDNAPILDRNGENSQIPRLDTESFHNRGELDDSYQIFIENVTILDANYKEANHFITGEDIIIHFCLQNQSKESVNISLGIAFYNSKDIEISRINTMRDNYRVNLLPGINRMTCKFNNICLLTDSYYISYYLACDQSLNTYHKIEQCSRIYIDTKFSASGWRAFDGIVGMSHKWITGDGQI